MRKSCANIIFYGRDSPISVKCRNAERGGYYMGRNDTSISFSSSQYSSIEADKISG